MFHVKMQMNKDENGNFIYPVPVADFNGSKYREDMQECVAIMEYETERPGVIQITQDEYNRYPFCQVTVDKELLTGDGLDEVTVNVSLPVAMGNQRVKLYDKDDMINFDYSDVNGQVIFKLKSTEIGKIFQLSAASELFKKNIDEDVLIKVI